MRVRMAVPIPLSVVVVFTLLSSQYLNVLMGFVTLIRQNFTFSICRKSDISGA